MRLPFALALSAVPALACTVVDHIDVSQTDQSVIGGAAAAPGKWPDAVAVMWQGQQGCSGTLIAPNLVVTAGHCVPAGDTPDQVLVGANKLSAPQEGQTIAVMKAIEYPNSQRSVDAGLLVLQSPATGVTPRTIGSGWARFDIKNDAAVQLVGFGTTDKNGNVSTDALMEATTTITDYNCSKTGVGCEPGAMPDGEFGAGGMGIDTCPGDSGGPVYLTTDYGTFVIGITSRGYDTNTVACSEGGIYERPDKIVDWMEEASGIKVARGPTPTADPITVLRGDGAETTITVNDPHMAAKHSFAITKMPAYGTAAVRDDGTVRVCASPGVAGPDAVEVTVTDTGDPTRALAVHIPITITDGTPADSCDVNAFESGGDGGGCCDTRRGAGGSIPLALFVVVALRRRRK